MRSASSFTMSSLWQVSRCVLGAAKTSGMRTHFKISGAFIATAQRAGRNRVQPLGPIGVFQRRSFCVSGRKDDAQRGDPTEELQTRKHFRMELCKPTDGRWKFLDGKQLEAISFEESFKVLKDHFESDPVAWVIGAPGCGKTSLSCAFSEHMQHEGWFVEWKLGLDIDVAFVKNFWRTHLSGQGRPKFDAKVLLIVDECQTIQVWSLMEDMLIKNTPMKLLLLGTDFPQSTENQCTPQELRDSKFWMFAPSADRSAVCKFAEAVLDLHGVPQTTSRIRWCESIFDVCGGNMNLILTSVRLLIETGNYPSTYDLIEARPRTVANGGGNWEPAKVELARRVCAVGATTVGEKDAARKLVRRGFLMPVRTDHVGRGLVKAQPGDYEQLTWATALQRDYAVICQKVSPLPTKEFQSAGVKQPLDLLLRLLPMLDVNFLVTCHIAGTGASSATEYHIQAAVLVAASKICRQGTFLNEWPIGRYRLDFLYIHDDGSRWGFEITRNAADVVNHINRFKGGAYRAACSDWLVVDFHTSPSSLAAPTNPNLVRISPHPCLGWDAFTVSFREKTVYVPRNGIPQYLVEGATQVRPCVEINQASATVGEQGGKMMALNATLWQYLGFLGLIAISCWVIVQVEKARAEEERPKVSQPAARVWANN